MSYQLYVTGGHGFTEAILPTLLHPSNAVDIVRDYFTRGYQGQHIDLPPDTDVSQASNLTDTQKQSLLDGLQEGHLVLSSRYEPGFALFSESRASPDTLRNDLPATLRQRLQRQWPGTSRGGGAVLRSDSLAPAEEPASNSTEPLAPESPAPGTGPYHVTLAYRWPDGTGVAGLPFTLGTDKDGIEGTLDQNGEARIEGLNGRFASVRLSSDASDDDVGHQRRGIQASLKELLKHEQKEADALAREYQQMPWHQRSAVSAGAILQGVADAGIGLLRFVDSMADLASPSQTLMDGLKSAWSASEGSSDTVWHESFQANYDEARHRRWVKALGFDPGDLSRKDIAEAYDLANLVMADPILRESLNDFIAEYASIQHHTEVSYVAGAVAFDLVLIALLAVATGGIGAAGAAGGQIRHTGLLRHLGKLIKGYGKALRKQRLRRLWRDTDLKKQNHLEDTAPKRVEGLKLKPAEYNTNKTKPLRDQIDDLSPEEQDLVRNFNAGFSPQGVSKEKALEFIFNTETGQAQLKSAKLGDPGAGNATILNRVLEQVQSGKSVPVKREVTRPLVKIVPESRNSAGYGPFFTTPEQLEIARNSGRPLSDAFGLPGGSDAEVYRVFQIQPKGSATVFESTIAPTVELNGKLRTQGGLQQFLVPDRSQFEDAIDLGLIRDNTGE